MRDVGGVWSTWWVTGIRRCAVHACAASGLSLHQITFAHGHSTAQHGQLTGLLTRWMCMEVNRILVDRKFFLVLQKFFQT